MNNGNHVYGSHLAPPIGEKPIEWGKKKVDPVYICEECQREAEYLIKTDEVRRCPSCWTVHRKRNSENV